MNADLPVEVTAPDTAAARAAYQVAAAYSSPALLNHALRSYCWGRFYAERQGLAYDDELYFVASVMHDLGLVREFDNHLEQFEHAGGHVAWVLTAGAGWPAWRRARAAEVIVRHMAVSVDPAVDVEGHLLLVATSMDISGVGIEALPPELRTDVLGMLPRLSLREEFIACFADQARRKPDGAAAEAMRAGLAERMRRNPME